MEVREKVINSIPDLMEVYKEIAEKTGVFVLIGVPIPPECNMNFNTAIWLNSMVSRPNVIAKYGTYKFASQAWNEAIEMVLNKWPFITHVLLTAADEFPINENAVDLMLALDKDVVAAPCPILQRNRGVCWNVATDPQIDPVNFLNWNKLPKEPFPITFAGNPWLIKRKVIEKMEWPYFKDVFRQEPGRKMGQDMYFSEQVRKAGFEFWCEPRAKFEHHKNIDLNYMMEENSNQTPYDLNWGEFSIEKTDWILLKKIIKEKNVKTVLEFGCGLSSLLISELVKVDSYETLEKYAELIKCKSDKRDTKDNLNIILWDGKHFDSDKQYDLVFVDGPVEDNSGSPGREYSIKAASEHSDKVIVHDAQRNSGKKWQEKYLKPNFDLVRTYRECNYWIKK